MRRKDLDSVTMREQRAQGALLRDIAAAHGCSVTTVWHRTRGVMLEGGDVIAGRNHGNSQVSMDVTNHGQG